MLDFFLDESRVYEVPFDTYVLLIGIIVEVVIEEIECLDHFLIGFSFRMHFYGSAIVAYGRFYLVVVDQVLEAILADAFTD
jgi:hypothetical protein